MISVQAAKNKIQAQVRTLGIEDRPLAGAFGRVLASDVRAPHSFPLFDVAAMDGFAVRSRDCRSAGSAVLKITGTLKAGDAPGLALKPGEAHRIMTGAGVPRGADAVVPKERVEVEGKTLLVPTQADVAPGDHIRRRAEETRKGDRAAHRGTALNSRWLGYLRNLGMEKVKVFRQPRISLLVTGSELVGPGEKLSPGKIFDSNLPMLTAALAEAGLAPCFTLKVRDEKAALKAALRKALAGADLVLLVGGVSVGDYDFSRPVLKELGVRTVFWGIAQKPGKPLYFGMKGSKLVFGLPGNPASVLVCFHEYVAPALRSLQGLRPDPAVCWARLENGAKADRGKTLFLKASLRQDARGPRVKVLAGQQSHKLKSLAEANCLVVLQPGRHGVKGQAVEVHPL